MSNIVFESLIVRPAGKSGVMRPDANGYYDVILGGFNIHNSADNYYPFDEVKNLFVKSSDLMSRVNNGQLYGEWGHPKQSPGMSNREYLLKLLTMHEEEISHHIRKIELDDSFKHNGKQCVAVMGSVKPFGPREKVVNDGLTTPDINFAFSLRSISWDKRAPDGTLIKIPKKIQTYDAVSEQGIEIADKAHNPAVESKHRELVVGELLDVPRHVFTLSDIEGALELAETRGTGLESKVYDLDNLLSIARRDRNGYINKESVRGVLGMTTTKPSKILSW